MVGCPAYDCSGSPNSALRITRPQQKGFLQEKWDNRGDREVWYCRHCHLYWLGEVVGDLPDITPLGYYNGLGLPRGFHRPPNAKMKAAF